MRTTIDGAPTFAVDHLEKYLRNYLPFLHKDVNNVNARLHSLPAGYD